MVTALRSRARLARAHGVSGAARTRRLGTRLGPGLVGARGGREERTPEHSKKMDLIAVTDRDELRELRVGLIGYQYCTVFHTKTHSGRLCPASASQRPIKRRHRRVGRGRHCPCCRATAPRLMSRASLENWTMGTRWLSGSIPFSARGKYH